MGLALAVAVVSALGIALFNDQIASAYTNDASVAALAAHLLVFAALFQLPDAVQVSTSCAIRAYKVTRSPMLIHMTAFWGICLPLGVVLGLAPAWLPWRPVEADGGAGFLDRAGRGLEHRGGRTGMVAQPFVVAVAARRGKNGVRGNKNSLTGAWA